MTAVAVTSCEYWRQQNLVQAPAAQYRRAISAEGLQTGNAAFPEENKGCVCKEIESRAGKPGAVGPSTLVSLKRLSFLKLTG